MRRSNHTHTRRLLCALFAITALSASGSQLALAAGPSRNPVARARPASAKPKPPPLELRVTPVVEACVDHHTRAQELRMKGKLLESRVAMRQCAAEECPALLQRDCVGWLDQMDTQMPSLTFRVTVDGQSRADAQLFIDGVARREPASGKAVELDPGRHRLRCVVPGVAPFEQDLVTSEGERYRMVDIALTSPAATASTPETYRPVPVMTYVLGGVALAGAVSGGIWATSSYSLRNELEDSCAPDCDERSVDELRRRSLVADVSWGVSVVSLLGATTFFLLRPEQAIEIDAAWLPGGGMATLRVDTF